MEDYYQEQWVSATERIIERLLDLKYEADGLESFDGDYRKQLREDGEWDAMVKEWETHDKPTEEELGILETRIDELKTVYDIMESARKGQVKQMRKRGFASDRYIFNYR